MKAIYKREVLASFNSMTGFLFAAALCVFVGIYFMVYNLFAGYPYFSTALESSLFVLLLAVPVLTMRSMAEDRRSRTDQLLLTAPVPIWGVVLGKYFALLTVFALPVGIAALCPLIIKLNGTAFLAADYGTLLAFFLLGAVEIAVGLLISALTVSQIIAAVGTFGILLLLFLWDGLVDYLPADAAGSLVGMGIILLLAALLIWTLSNSWKIAGIAFVLGIVVLVGFYLYDSASFAGLLPGILGQFSLLSAFNSFAADHIFNFTGLLLYLSLSALLVFLTVQVVQRRRWS